MKNKTVSKGEVLYFSKDSTKELASLRMLINEEHS
jgi:hypothetical protein